VSLDSETGHRYQKHQERQSSQHGGEKPGVRGVIALRPWGGELWSLFEDDGYDREEARGKDDRKQLASCWLRWPMGLWWSEGRFFR
jgi:hypothetical protein